MNQTATLEIMLPPSITIENAEDFANELKKIEPVQGTTLVLNASGTNSVTTPGVQLLLSLHKSLLLCGGKLIIIGCSEIFTQSFQLIGLQSQLAAWSESDA